MRPDHFPSVLIRGDEPLLRVIGNGGKRSGRDRANPDAAEGIQFGGAGSNYHWLQPRETATMSEKAL